MIPKILKDIENYLKEYQIQISENIEGEGRGGSLKDEGSIKRALLENKKLNQHILSVEARGMGDMIVLDYDKKTKYVVDIKTSLGNNDNCFTKKGMVYAFTKLSIEKVPGSMNWKEFNNLIEENRADIFGKDYWFLCVDKKDSSNVLLRGAKQINAWTINRNPSNILQINWGKEKDLKPVKRTWDEAYDAIINKVKISLNGHWDSIPEEWKDEKYKKN